MTEDQAIMVSIILNMAVDGKTQLHQLSPHVADYIEGLVEEYQLDTEKNADLYWFAHEALSQNSDRKVH